MKKLIALLTACTLICVGLYPCHNAFAANRTITIDSCQPFNPQKTYSVYFKDSSTSKADNYNVLLTYNSKSFNISPSKVVRDGINGRTYIVITIPAIPDSLWTRSCSCTLKITNSNTKVSSTSSSYICPSNIIYRQVGSGRTVESNKYSTSIVANRDMKRSQPFTAKVSLSETNTVSAELGLSWKAVSFKFGFSSSTTYTAEASTEVTVNPSSKRDVYFKPTGYSVKIEAICPPNFTLRGKENTIKTGYAIEWNNYKVTVGANKKI